MPKCQLCTKIGGPEATPRKSVMELTITGTEIPPVPVCAECLQSVTNASQQYESSVDYVVLLLLTTNTELIRQAYIASKKLADGLATQPIRESTNNSWDVN